MIVAAVLVAYVAIAVACGAWTYRKDMRDSIVDPSPDSEELMIALGLGFMWPFLVLGAPFIAVMWVGEKLIEKGAYYLAPKEVRRLNKPERAKEKK